MTNHILKNWLVHYDPIHLGLTGAGIANGVFAAGGMGFPRIRGGYNLYRGEGSLGAVDWSAPAGAAGADARQVKNFTWRGHEAGGVYFHVLRAIGGGGVEEENTRVFARVEFGANGEWPGRLANRPANLRVEPLAGGRFRVRWSYCAKDEGAAPAEFRVFSDGGSGSVDFGVPVGTVGYRTGVCDYRFETAGYPHGTRVRFAVRAVTAAGAEERNEQIVVGVAMATGPAVHGTVIVQRSEGNAEW